MQVPLEISYRGMSKSPALETLIQEKVAKLEQVCNYLISCRVAVEKAQATHAGNPFRIRIDLRVPPSHEIVSTYEPGRGHEQEAIQEMVRTAFDAARRQLQELVDRQRGSTKTHPSNESNGVVDKLFRDGGYGFIKSADGRDIFFHEHSVVNGDFVRLEVGTGVRYVEQTGEKGPQASTVQVMDTRPNSPIV